MRKGHRVAIAEQTSEPDGRTLVSRDVVRVVTPGTVIEPGMLDSGANNYLVAVAPGGAQSGIAFVDITTGEFAVTQLPSGAVPQEIARLAPSELLLPEGGEVPAFAGMTEGAGMTRGAGVTEGAGMTGGAGAVGCHVTRVDRAAFAPNAARRRVLDHFGVRSLDAFGCEGLEFATAAAAVVLDYVGGTHMAVLPLLTGLRTYLTDAFMALDPQTRRNLELFEGGRWGAKGQSLLSVLDQTQTPMGARALRRWVGQPLLDIDALERRLDAVAWLHASDVRRQRIRAELAEVSDLERVVQRVGTGLAVPRELVGLRRSLERVPALRSLTEEAGADLAWLTSELDPCTGAVERIKATIADDPQGDVGQGRVVREGYSEEMDEVRMAAQDARSYIAGLERKERERTGIPNLKVGYNKVFGYYLEVSNAHSASVPEDYVRRQTLVNAERFYTQELKEHENRVLSAGDRLQELEAAIYKQVCRETASHTSAILATAAALATLDALLSLAEAAVHYGYVRPVLDESERLVLRDARHPVVERFLPSGAFVPNDADLSTDENQLVILTGPNMAGKSTYLRQVAVAVLMAQIGSFVPAAEAHVGLVDRIFTRVGLQDDLATGQSTFMVEMVETAAILHHATRRSLVILDEIGRGTSTFDGLSIAQAVAEHIHDATRLGCRTLFATHYHELTALADRLPRVRNLSVAVSDRDGEVVFLHRIVHRRRGQELRRARRATRGTAEAAHLAGEGAAGGARGHARGGPHPGQASAAGRATAERDAAVRRRSAGGVAHPRRTARDGPGQPHPEPRRWTCSPSCASVRARGDDRSVVGRVRDGVAGAGGAGAGTVRRDGTCHAGDDTQGRLSSRQPCGVLHLRGRAVPRHDLAVVQGAGPAARPPVHGDEHGARPDAEGRRVQDGGRRDRGDRRSRAAGMVCGAPRAHGFLA